MTRGVLFDLDDTLFDHHHSARAALARVHQDFAATVEFDALEQHHTRYLEEMHVEVLAGRIGLDDARSERFRRVFAALGVELSTEQTRQVASAYRSGYLDARRAINGAADLLAAVRLEARIAIVSNNLLDEQREKLQFCGLEPFVDALVVSEETGISKPDPRIFHIALERLEIAPAGAVMVGDSWAADILGAHAAGIRAVWFNPRGNPRPPESAVVRVEETASLTPLDRVLPLLIGTRHPVSGR